MRNFIRPVFCIAFGLVLVSEAIATEPSLPEGLSEKKPDRKEEPSLPIGLGRPEKPTEHMEVDVPSVWDALEVGGFYELRYGRRVTDFRAYRNTTLGEARLQVDAEWSGDWADVNLTTDFVVDQVLNDRAVDFEDGEGWIDLREATILLRPFETLDLKIGRQILTWGTGDLIFINDLFPKDWNSFFVGRDDEYLKAPSDAVKASLFWRGFTVDAVYTPRFDSDRFVDGRRLTFFDPMIGGVKSSPTPVDVIKRDEYGEDWEGALRVSGQVKSFEWAGYAYKGFWKSPMGFDPVIGKAIFPELNVYGASLRGPVGGGIAHGEIGFYDARDEGAAIDPFLPNSEWRFLVGFEREIIPDLTGNIQYYVEHVSEYDNYLATLPLGLPAKDENRHLITLRLTQLLMNQNVTLSLFNFWSPSDEDGYLRLRVGYKVSDSWKIEGGANGFYGSDISSFFGQFQDNSNIFISVRTSF